MKIGVLIDRMNVGGVEKIAVEQVRALRELGEDAYLVVLREKAVVENAFTDLIKNVPIVYLDRRLNHFTRFSFQFPVFHFFSSFHLTYPLFIPHVLKKKEFDYFIVHGTYTAFSAITIKKTAKIPFSVFIWDPIDYILDRVYSKNFLKPFLAILHMLARNLDKKIITNADAILVGGDAHNAYFKKVDPNKKIITIPPYVHPLKKLPQQKKVFALMVTAWKEGKNPEYIFELLKAYSKLTVIMAGKWLDIDYLNKFRKLVKKHGVTKRLTITGAITEEQLTKYYQGALFLLQTNDDRGFGLPALEAAGHGTTFIIPSGQGVCNLFKDKTDGYYVKEHDTKKILDHIQYLYEHKESAKKMGEKAWEKVTKKYSWHQHASMLIKLIKTYEKK